MIKRKIIKPATPAQKDARERNWNKGQMSCMIAIAKRTINSKTTNEVEKTLLAMTIDSLNAILENWNK